MLGLNAQYVVERFRYVQPLKNLAAKTKYPRDIAERLNERGISHLLINYELFNFYVKRYRLHEKQMLKDFFELFIIQEFVKDGNCF